MTATSGLVVRVRTALAEQAVREVAMFGGVSFMVDGRMVAAARGDGDLLLRVDPARAEELLADGARRARMGRRTMSTGWLSIPPEELTTDERLREWLSRALPAC